MAPSRRAVLALPQSGVADLTADERRLRPQVRLAAASATVMGGSQQREAPVHSRSGDGGGSRSSSRPLVPMPNVQQYPSSATFIRELMEGRRTCFSAAWRCVFADGQLYEVNTLPHS